MDLPALANLCLQGIGTRTTVTQAELTNQTSNEAIQFNLAVSQTRDELLRMAQWDCAKGTIDLNYITSLPGTPENQSQVTNQNQWTPGIPIPPWTYEYQYPVDCLRAIKIVPSMNPGLNGLPIYPSSTPTGYGTIWSGPPIKFEVALDQFYEVTAAAVASGGSGYNVGDLIVLPGGLTYTSGNNLAPIGASAVLQVTAAPGGVISAVSVATAVLGEDSPLGGSYFSQPANPVAQQSTSGSGTGATFNLTWTSTQGNQRVVLTNQEFATLQYVRQVTDPNVMDSLFIKAWYNILSATLAVSLTGDKGLANQKIALANNTIMEARSVDANEGLTINDVTPDFIRIRGVVYSDYWNSGGYYDWGGLWPAY